MAVQPGELDGRFIRFRAGAAKKRFAHPRQGAQSRRQFFLASYLVNVRGMDDACGLIGDGFNQRRMGMAQTGHGDAGERIEITITSLIP